MDRTQLQQGEAEYGVVADHHRVSGSHADCSVSECSCHLQKDESSGHCDVTITQLKESSSQ